VRVLLVVLVAVHGLIHLMGPAKAFGWAELPDLRLPLSRTAGVLWLLTALLFLLTAVWILATPGFPAREWWWIAALPAIGLSQVLIVRSWSDAKFGTPANAVILVPALVAALGALPSGYRAMYRDLTAVHAGAPADARLVAEADLTPLPPSVQRYLRFMDVVGKPRVRDFRVRFSGGLRQRPGDAWMPTVAEQRSAFHPNRRVFLARSTTYGVPFEALHVFDGPAASFQVKIASLIRIVDARGPEMNRSETVTMFNDMWLLAPASLVDADIAYSEVDGRTYERRRWTTPITRYAVVDGVKVPVEADACWALDEPAGGEFAYARFTITSIAYNLNAD
jgi:hypothetical protein